MTTRRFGAYSFESSNEDKLLFPEAGIRKGALIDYYLAVADAMLPHLRDRPLTLRRFPDGISRDGFYQKQIGEYFPEWIARTTVQKVAGGRQTLVVCNNKATLAYLAEQATIALHPWLSRADRPDHPDQLVIDLDPPGEDFAPVRGAALRVKALLDELSLPGFLKTTGSRGLHVIIPLDRRSDFDAARATVRGMMQILAERHPDSLTTAQRKQRRGGRVFLDTGRNAYGQNAVACYSVRALPGAPVAAPLDWEELEDERLHARSFTLGNTPERVAERRDPWRELRRSAVSLERVAGAVARVKEGDQR